MRTLNLPRAVRSIGDKKANLSFLFCDACRLEIGERDVPNHIHGTRIKEVRVE